MSDTLKRIAWSFGEGFLAGLAVAIPTTARVDCSTDLETVIVWGGAIVVGAVTAGLSAVKNAVFPEGSTWR